ncbi:hypothetical protein PCYB_006370 [Plasmodium cynomolgi strain B]|uniref:CYIR protein n=1 Tax=Plasmodium cynomolgi (strain B) TaxID=1120755 RepID=K6UNX3_PLACD|nr:hypothetical protein PCYB_006370 [Plasmodium cynomolgi strain B]GAB69888.1 hypothetical protein PCYB_006370 [Plasmodium cynomolgi strain B]
MFLSYYSFCINSTHYNEVFLDYVKNNKEDNAVVKDIKCDSIQSIKAISGVLSAEDICKEFVLLYKSFSEYHNKLRTLDKEIFSFVDCDFLNYWLNDKLRKSVKDGDEIDVRGFYREIKNNNPKFFSDNEGLENYINNIDPEILKNMKLLYDLYYNKNIILTMLDGDYTYPENNPCSDYTKDCHEEYDIAINRCYGVYDEFYKALKDFKNDYNSIFRISTKDEYNCRGNNQYLLMEYDPVLERYREEKKIMLIQGLTISLIPLLIIPLIYKVKKYH